MDLVGAGVKANSYILKKNRGKFKKESEPGSLGCARDDAKKRTRGLLLDQPLLTGRSPHLLFSRDAGVIPARARQRSAALTLSAGLTPGASFSPTAESKRRAARISRFTLRRRRRDRPPHR